MWRLEGLFLTVAGLTLAIWARACYARMSRSRPDSTPSVPRGPYTLIRHPILVADGLFFAGISLMGVSELGLGISLITLAAIRLFLVPKLEHEFLNSSSFWQTYRDQTGCFFVPLGSFRNREYRVPERFGLSAILTLLTTFAILFGLLNFANAPPAVYLFLGLQISAICLTQIMLGSAPRSGSAFCGAVLLPVCILMTFDFPPLMPRDIFLYCLLFLVGSGAVLGYIFGALAAGFFLVMDLFDPHLTAPQKLAS